MQIYKISGVFDMSKIQFFSNLDPDAMGCQQAIADRIVERKADYLWQVRRVKKSDQKEQNRRNE
jgi:hypothetical protein